MLTVVERTQYSELVALEGCVAVLAGAALGDGCRADFRAVPKRRAKSGRRWDFDTRTGRFSLSIENFSDRQAQVQSGTIRLARFLGSIPGGKGEIAVLRLDEDEGGLDGWSYDVETANGQRWSVILGIDQPAFKSPFGALVRRHGAAFFSLAASLPQAFEGGASVRADHCRFFLRDPAGETLVLLFPPAVEGGVIRFEIKGDVMENLDENCRPTISLGKIEMPISDVLGLRPGMIIQFDRPETFEVQLEVFGTPVASGTMTMDDSRMILKVEELKP